MEVFLQTQLRWTGSILDSGNRRGSDDKRWQLRSKEPFKVCFKKKGENISRLKRDGNTSTSLHFILSNHEPRKFNV